MSDKAEKDAREIVDRVQDNFGLPVGAPEMLGREVAAALRARQGVIHELTRSIQLLRDALAAVQPHIAERDRLRAERDAAVEALQWIASEGMDDGDIHSFDQFTLAESAIMLLNRARDTLARLPQAPERARLVEALIAAVRTGTHDQVLAALDALDAHDQGAGGG